MSRASMNPTQKAAAEYYAMRSISWEDVHWLCGGLNYEEEQQIKEYAETYGLKLNYHLLNCELKRSTDRLFEHAALMAEEYDLSIKDLSVTEVLKSLKIYISKGTVVY